MVPLARRAECVGDRYDVEIRSSRKQLHVAESKVNVQVDAHTLASTVSYTDEVTRVEDGRSTLVRRTFHTAGKDMDAGEIDPRARDGRDFLRQFDRLLPERARMGERWNADGVLDAVPSDTLMPDVAAWRSARCSCRLVELARGRRAVADVTIDLGGGPGRPQLKGMLTFDIAAGLLSDVDLRGRDGDDEISIHASRTVTPAGGAPAPPK